MKLSKQMKIAVIVLGCFLLLAASAGAVIEWKVPRYEEKKEVYYAYTSKGSIDYRVYLKPNIMFQEPYLEKNLYYVFKYIDHLEIEFQYDFSGSKTANLKSEYSVKAYLQGLHGNDREVLWSDESLLVPENVDQGDYSGKAIHKKVSISLDPYAQKKEAIFLDSEVNSPVILNIVFDIHVTAVTEKGTLEDKLSPNLTIPIGESVFKMDGKLELSGSNKIETTRTVLIPMNIDKIIVLSVVSFLLLVMLIMVALSKVKDPPDPYDKAIANIFKEYGERLAGMEHTISYQLSDVISVKSIEDMVKIADEVGQPVFYYKVDSRLERKIEFYVFDSSRIYYMVIFGEIKIEDEDAPEKGEGLPLEE